MENTSEIYSATIDDTWTEIDLTQFKKENPKYSNERILNAMIDTIDEENDELCKLFGNK